MDDVDNRIGSDPQALEQVEFIQSKYEVVKEGWEIDKWKGLFYKLRLI